MKYIPMELADGGKWIAAFDDIDIIRDNEIIYHGSFQIPAARLLGLSYPDYLRFIQSRGAILKGKEGYCYGYFKDKAAAKRMCVLLNGKFDQLKKELG